MSSKFSPVVDRIRIIPRSDDFLDRNVGSSGEVFYDQQSNTGPYLGFLLFKEQL